MKYSLQSWLLGLACIGIVIADQASKWLTITYGTAAEYAINTGVCWGIGGEFTAQYVLFSWALRLGIFIFTLFVVWQGVCAHNLHKRLWPYALIVVGAFSNSIDRMIFDGVIDFIVLKLSLPVFGTFNWPWFNIADIAIVGGLCGLLYYELLCTCQARS
ncbi:MAG: hypothetical protein UU47_C0014G0020 [candidate division TM6 bacterium GW2011_GWE2_41_16]|nr:MAG: hypothetical protein UU47_C0014G0020 [candidate division TM6 bacterium GW2011_GWE2_41_16]